MARLLLTKSALVDRIRMKLVALLVNASVLIGGTALSVRAETIVFDSSGADWNTVFDTPTVDVTVGTLPSIAPLQVFGPSFSDLPFAAFTDPTASIFIDLVPVTGNSVTLSSFDLGNFLGFGDTTTYSVFDRANLSTPVVQATIPVPYSDSSHTTVSVSETSTAGLKLVVGPDLFNIGLNNIVFSSSPAGGPISTPDAGATVALLGLGMLACGLSRRI
jgi:hypothetical protein